MIAVSSLASSAGLLTSCSRTVRPEDYHTCPQNFCIEFNFLESMCYYFIYAHGDCFVNIYLFFFFPFGIGD